MLHGTNFVFCVYSRLNFAEQKYEVKNVGTYCKEGLRGQCNKIFDIFYGSNPSKAPDKQAKMIFIKNSFSQVRLSAVLAGAESDSAQC